ncbi:hypothetical protein H2203_007559 [Taxawa tesnikishii (nom. ined.)]|nr:hypothetical protein H2203_007559 [Dothideales sp. JES 119]
MAPWFAFLEAYMVQRLLRSPTFHRAVGKVHKSVHRIRHGTPPEEMGGTKLDRPEGPGFLNHFMDEVRDQLGRPATKRQPPPPPSKTQHNSQAQGDGEANHGTQQPGFLSHFVDEIKEQFRGGGRRQ